MRSLSVKFRLFIAIGVALALIDQVHSGPINSIVEKTDGAMMSQIESDESPDADPSMMEQQGIPNPQAVAEAQAALLALDEEIHGDMDAIAAAEAAGVDPSEVETMRERRSIRFWTNLYCMFFRSSARCVQPEPVSTSSDNDDFWLNYLNSNGTEPITTTTPRPATWWGRAIQRKREFLGIFFPNLFGGRGAGGGGGGVLSGLSGLLGGGGGGGGGGSFLSGILQNAMRLFSSFSGGGGGSGGGYPNSF